MAGLDGKGALVTGGGSGIGAASAKRLASEGAKLLVTDINLDAAEAVAAEIRGSGGEAHAASCDIGEEDQIAKAFSRAVDIFGRLDVVHNNAALLTSDTLANDIDILSIPTETWDAVMRVTLRGTMAGCKYAIKAMKGSDGGSIINTSSMLGLAADYGLPAYSAAKAAINMVTTSVAARYGRDGIRCNAVAPSVIYTPLRGGSGNLNSGDKGIADLTAAMLAARRRQDEQTTPPEPQPGVQGQGSFGCRERREDAGRVGAAV